MPELPPVAVTVEEVRAAVAPRGAEGRTVGLVPTMGALHAGHARLIDAARRASDFVVVSVFVNPTQFGPGEDFERYPRTFEADRRLCAEHGTDLIFAPTREVMYPEPFRTSVEVAELQDVLCGASRPGHFRGVCTVVLKLFNIVGPDVAVFGQKDAQQALIIRQMVRDLNVPVRLLVEPTVREPDGLALRSRNRYLDPEQRRQATVLYRALREAEEAVAAGERDAARLEALLAGAIAREPGARVDYARVLDAETLRPIARLERPALAAVAAFFGGTRLIDNVTLRPH